MLKFRLCLAMLAISIWACDSADEVHTPMNGLMFTTVEIDPNVEGPAFLEVADVNGDGFSDLILSSFGLIEGTVMNPGTLSVYLGDGTLTNFRKVSVVNIEEEIYFPNDPIIHDVDEDGDMDIVLGFGFLACNFLERKAADGTIQPPSACGGLSWFEQDGEQWHRHDLVGPNSELFYHRTLFSDLNGDGIKDLISVGENRPAEGASGDEAQAFVMKGLLPLGTFSQGENIGSGLGSLPELFDVDADGDLDLISAEYFAGQGASFVWFERSYAETSDMPIWTRHVITDTLGPSIQLSFVPNLFGDGQAIAVGSNHSNTTLPDGDDWISGIYVLNPGSDVRQHWNAELVSENMVSRPIRNQAAPGIFGWGDVDRDGDIDLVVSGDGDSRIFVLEQTADKSFITWTLAEDLAQAGGPKVKDLNGDGSPEIIITSWENSRFQLYTTSTSEGQALVPTIEPEWAQPPIETPVRVNFEGEVGGPLILGLFNEYPPQGGPLSFKLVQTPVSGDTHMLNFADAGNYVLLAFIDSDGSGPMGITEGDPHAIIDITLPVTSPVEATLTTDAAAAMDTTNLKSTVVVNVSYDGPQDAQLVVASFASLPVMGPPDTYQVVEAGQGFPVQVTLEDVPNATCQILAFLAKGGNPSFPSDIDPKIESEMLQLDGTVKEIDLSLNDP